MSLMQVPAVDPNADLPICSPVISGHFQEELEATPPGPSASRFIRPFHP
jgi:hypothetical protein